MTYFFVGGSQRRELFDKVSCSDQTTSLLVQEAFPFRAMISTYQLGKTILAPKLKDYLADLNEL